MYASWCQLDHVADDALRVSIGRPIANTTLHVLDRHRRQVPPGVPGELFIGGDGLAVTYFGDPELTALKFVPDPYSSRPCRMYATGDLVVRDPDGDLVFLGRIDDQIKIRGFRVEPIEVEAALRLIPGVSAAVVMPHVVDGYPRLVAYVISDRVLEPPDVREQLRQHLPDYLVPSHVVLMDEFPLTRSGKLDRVNLPNPFERSVVDVGLSVLDDTPDNRLTASIVDLWREVLGLGEIDSDGTFFDAGGDSLLAVRLYGAVQRRFGVVLTSGIIDQDFTARGSSTPSATRSVGRLRLSSSR